MLYYNKCDQLGFQVFYTKGTTIADSCTWNILYKSDTCTGTNYDCKNTAYYETDSGTVIGVDGTARLYNIGTASTFNYIHRTGIFRIELNLATVYTSGSIVLLSNRTTTGNGIYVVQTSATALNVQIGSGSATVLNATFANVFYAWTPTVDYWGVNRIRLIIKGNGTGVTVYRQHGDAGTLDSISTSNYTGAIVNSGDAATPLAILGTHTAKSAGAFVQAFKFWSTTDESTPFANFQLYGVNYLKETILGLTATADGSVYPVNLGAITFNRPCYLQGWKYSTSNLLDTIAGLDLMHVNKPIYIYASGKPYSSDDRYGEFGAYMLMMPKDTPVKVAKKLVKKGTLMLVTKNHYFYSYGCNYSNL